MVMDPQFSPQEAELFFVLAGSRPPLANRDKMLATRDAFLQAQQAVISRLSPGVARLVTRSLMSMDGAVAAGFAQSMESLNSAPPYYLPSLADQYQGLANYIDTTADEFLRMKVDSIIALASLLVTIAMDLAIAVFFPGIGLSAIASEFVIVRFLLSTLIGRLLTHLIMAAVTSVAIQEALDVIGQLVVNAELHQDWNWAETAMQAEVGLLGGAMGLVLMPVDHMLGEFLGNALVKGVDGALGATLGTELGDVGKDVVHAAGEFTAGALVGGVHNAGHETLFNAMLGNGLSWNWGTFSGGAAQGVAGMVARGVAAGFKMATMVATLPVEQLLVRGLNESISPAVLNDIATYRPPPPDGGPGGGPEGGTAVGAEAAPGEAAVPPVVALLNAIDVPAGPETAYAIALRTGFVPIVGSPSDHPLLAEPLTAQVPMAGYLVPAQTGPAQNGAVTVQPEQTAALPAGQQAIHEPTAPESAPPPYSQQPVMVQPVTGQPVTGEQVTGQPVSGEQVAGQPLPPTGQQATVQPTPQAAVQPVTQQPVTQQPVTQQPVTQQPTSGSLLDEPLPASAARMQVLAPDVSAPGHVQSGSAESAVVEPAVQVGQQPRVAGDSVAGPPVTEQVPQAGSVLPGQRVPDQQEAAQPGQDTAQAASQGARATAGGPLPQQSDRPSETSGDPTATPAQARAQDTAGAGIKRDAATAGTAPVAPGRTGRELAAQPGSEATKPVGQSHPRPGVESGGPGVLGDPVRPHELLAAGTQWAGSGGWHVSEGTGTLELRPGSGGEPRMAELPAGSKAVFGRSGEVQLVVSPRGDSFVRGLDGQLSPARELEVKKNDDPVLLKTGDGQLNVALGRENEAILQNGVPVAYREVTPFRRFIDGGGAWRAGENKVGALSAPRTFVPDGEGFWTDVGSVDSETVQAFLAGANGAHDEARFFHDIVDRNNPSLPESERLSTMDDVALKHLYDSGSLDDRFAAVYESARRGGPGVGGLSARWTQVKAIRALVNREIVDQKTGEGKTLGFLGAAGVLAKGDARAVHFFTSHDHLAETAYKEFSAVLGRLGVRVFRMDHNNPPPPADGEPTIYVGTAQDGAFHWLKSDGLLFGQRDKSDPAVFDVLMDEFDKTFAYDRSGGYFISDGERGAALPEVAEQVRKWNDFLTEHLDRPDGLTAEHFGRFPGQVGGIATLTEAGKAKVTELAQADGLVSQDLAPGQERLLNDAAAARLGLKLNDDYVVHDDEIVIMDQTTGYPLKDPSTANSSRWFTYAPHLEALHKLTIRDDGGGPKNTNNKDFFTLPGYGRGERVRGASGTAAGGGKENAYAAQGVSGTTTVIPRYYASRLKASEPRVFHDEEAKLDAMAADIKRIRDGGAGQPQLRIFPRNSQVAELAKRLDALDVPHQVIDGRWMLEQGPDLEAQLERARENAGQLGMVTIANNVFGRGADFKTSFTVKEAGGLDQRTGGQGLPDILEQAANRAGRSGDPGTTGLDFSVEDPFLTNSDDPYAHLAVAHYIQAHQNRETVIENSAEPGGGDNLAASDALRAAELALKDAGQGLLDLLPRLYAQAANKLGFNIPIPALPSSAALLSPAASPSPATADSGGTADSTAATETDTGRTREAMAAHADGSAGGKGRYRATAEDVDEEPSSLPSLSVDFPRLLFNEPNYVPAAQQLQEFQAEQRVLTGKLRASMITSTAAEQLQLQARLTEVDAAIQQHTAEAAREASQIAPAPATPEHAATPGPTALAGPVVRNTTGVSFNTGTASSRQTAAQAAAAVPGAVTRDGKGLWATVGGHSGPGFIEIHGVKWTVAEALELPSVRASLEDAKAIVLTLCDAVVPGDGVPSVAEQFAAATGKPILTTDQRVIVDGPEVVTGQLPYDASGRPMVERGGTWKLIERGKEPRDLETFSLLEAYDKLGVTPLPAGPAPAEPVAFFSTGSSTSSEQVASTAKVQDAHRLVAEMDQLARAAHEAGLMDAVSGEALAEVEKDLRRLLSRPETKGAPTAKKRAEIVARIGRLNGIHDVVSSQTAVDRSKNLVDEYARAVGEAAPPQNDAQIVATGQAALAAAYVTRLAELAPRIRDARDAAAPAELPSSIAEQLDAAQARARRAATDARASGENEDAAFSASVDASLANELRGRTVDLAKATAIPERAVRAGKVVASARMDPRLAARLAQPQIIALDVVGYTAVSQPPPAADLARSFYESLIAVAEAKLSAVLGKPPTTDRVRRRIVEELKTGSIDRYQHLLADSKTPAQVLADLKARRSWDSQVANLVAHVAADAFGIDLRVMGGLGEAPEVGKVGGPRTAGPDGQSYLLVRQADGRFIPAVRRPGAPPPRWPLVATPVPGEASAWGRELSPEQRRLVAQEATGVPMPEGAAAPTDAGLLAEMDYLAKERADALSRVESKLREALVGYIGKIVLGTPLERAAIDALAEIAEAGSFEQQIEQFIESDPFTRRSAELTQEYSRAAQADRPLPDLADRAGAAARVKTLVEQADPGLWGGAQLPVQLSAILSELDRRGDEALNPVWDAAQEAIAQGVDDVAVTRAVYDAADAVAGRMLLNLHSQIDGLADGLILRNLRHGFRDLLGVAQLQAASAAATVEDNLRPHRDAEQATREWHVRDRAALEEFDGGTDSLELPPGFGAPVLDAAGQPKVDSSGRIIRQYPLGHNGRFLGLGDAAVEDRATIAQLVADSLHPQEAHLAGAVRDQVAAFMKKQGRHAFTQELLEGGLTVYVKTRESDGQGRPMTVPVQVNLDLDLDQVHHVRQLETEGTPVRQQRHHPVEAEKEWQAFLRRTVALDRSVAGAIDVLTPSGGAGLLATFSAAISGTASTSYTTGYDIVSAAKRIPRYEHKSAYFDFSGARLRTTVYGARPAGMLSMLPGLRGRPGRSHTRELKARAAFPIENTPPKRPGDPPGAFRETPRELPDSKRFGYTQAELANDPDGSRERAAKRVEKVLHHVLSEPEWVGAGVKELRDQVLNTLYRDGQVDEHVIESVNKILSEPAILRGYSDLFGAGVVSPMIRDEQGRNIGQLVVTARLRTVQPSWTGEMGIKEESQRFTSVPNEREQAGSAVLTVSGQLGTGGVSRGGGVEKLGEKSEVSGGFQAGGAVSASRKESANTGSGDIRGMVLWDHSEHDLAETIFTVKLVKPGDTDGTVRQFQQPVQMGLTIPRIQVPRWKYRLEEAVSGQAPPGPVPVDDEPDAAGSLRYPPESMVAGKGIGFSMISYLQGSEDVLPEILKLIREAEQGKAYPKAWTPEREAYLQSMFTPRFTREALTSHASILFQPGGIQYQFSVPGVSGNEIITVTVAATHGQTPSALGRVNDATLEVMPSAFAGHGGEDTVGSGVNLNALITVIKALGEHAEPKGLGALLQLALARSVTNTTGASATGFSLQAMLYRGPARLFTYDDVEYKIEVDVRHQPGLSLPGLGHWGTQAVADRAVQALGLRPEQAAQPRGTGKSTLTGSVQFISHEELARDKPVDPAAVRNVGQIDVLENFGKGQRGWAAAAGGARTPVELPPVTPYLGEDGHVVVNPDDQVMEVLTPHPFAEIIKTLLVDAGLGDDEIGDTLRVLTEPAHLAAAIGGIRPGEIRHAFVKKANPLKFEFQDRHVGLTIEGFPTNARQFGDRPVKLFQMHVAEGGPVVSSGESTTTLVGLNTAVPGLSELFGKDPFNWLQEITYGHGWYNTKGTTESLGLTQGRLLQATRTYLEATADVVYRVHVTAQNKSLALDGDVEYFGKIIRVKDGLSWLTLDKPAADPRDPAPGPPPDTDTVMVIGRRPAGDPQVQQEPKKPRRRLVDFVRATRKKADNRKIAWLQFLPPSTGSERLYPRKKKSAGPPDVSGEGNPVLDAVQDMLRKRAPWALESHTTFEIELPGTAHGAGRTGKRRVRGRLANVLNLQSLTMMMDMLTSTGLVIHAVQQGPGHNKRAQLVLQARRDPHNLGYVYLESVEGNTTRYTTGLDVKNTNWTKLQSGAVATAASQTGQPTNNSTTGPSAAGGGAPGQATAPSGGFNNWTLHPEGDIGQDTGKGGYHQTMDAQRDTLFHAGRADRYGGDVDLTISLVTTWQPSTLLNKFGLNLPRYGAARLQKTANQRGVTDTVVVPLKERVLIPHGLIHHEITPEPPPDDAVAIEEVPLPAAGGPAAGALNVTAKDFLKRRVLNLGWDGRKLQALFPELMAKLAGNERPLSGQRSHAVARHTEHGTRNQDALRYIFSAPMLNRYLERMLGQEGMTMPTLVREGGTLTDTYGDVTVQVELAPDPLVLSNYTIWDEGVAYGFDETGQGVSRNAGWSFGATGGAGFRAGNVHHATPPAPTVTDFSISAAVGTHEERSATAVQQHLMKGEALHRALSWLRVSPDATITVRFKAHNKRDWMDVSELAERLGGVAEWLEGGEVAVRFLVRNALELALSPEASIDLGIYHPGGIPVGSGTFFPPPPGRRPVGTEDLVRAAYSLPFLEGAFGVQIDWDGEHFRAGDRQIDAGELAAQIKIRLGELGDPPSPDLAEEERPPPGPTKLKDPGDPIVLISPNAAVRAPGQAVSPAQALADALGRPVLAPDSSYRITRDGSVLAVRQLIPDATVLGRGWQDGQWVAVFPRAQGRDPHPLPSRNLADAIREAQQELKWTLKVGGRPELVPPPGRDVHYPVQIPRAAITKWRDDLTAAQRLAAAARDLLPHTGNRSAELEHELDRADSATRAVAGPPAALPAAAKDRAATWQNLTQFHDAAGDLGRVVTEVLTAAFTQWQQRIDPYQQWSRQARELLTRNGQPVQALVDALDQFDAAVREIPAPPAGLPGTAAQVSDTAAAIERIAARQREADKALSAVLTLGVEQLGRGWSQRRRWREQQPGCCPTRAGAGLTWPEGST